MDTFDLKKFLTEGKLYKEAEDNTGGVSFDDNETTKDPIDAMKQIFIDSKGFPGNEEGFESNHEILTQFQKDYNLDDTELESLLGVADEWYWNEYDINKKENQLNLEATDDTGGIEFSNDEEGEMPWDSNHPDWEEDTSTPEERTIAMLDGSANISILKDLEDNMRFAWSEWNDEGFEKEDMIKWFQWKLDNI